MRAFTFSVLLVASASLFAQNQNIAFRSTLNFPGQTCANIWGIKKNGKEYALVGLSQGLAIVDVTDPQNPSLLTQLTDGINSLWREVKTYGNYVYMTSEGTASGQGGVLIANLSNLPNLPVPFHKYTGDGTITNQLHRAHALHVDTVAGYAYIFGTTGLANGGAVALNLNTDPYNPTYAGMYNGSYIHDGYAHNDTLWGGHIYGGYFSCINFANKTSPVVLATQTTPNAFTHNTWLSADGNYIFTTDEKSNSYLAAYNIDNLSNIVETDRIQTTPGSGSIVHNTHIKTHYAISSWYKDGVTIVDVRRPGNLIQVGKYDTYTAGAGNGFDGAWGVYPFLPSGNLLVTNIEENLGGGIEGGVLYVLTPTYVEACFLEGNVKDASTNLNLSGVTVEIQHTDPLNKGSTGLNGNYATGQPTSGNFQVTFSKTNYISQTLPATLVNGEVTTLNVLLMPVIVLPLEWLSFEAKAEENVNVLTWRTVREKNTLRHEIQAKRSAEQPWQTIGEQVAAGNSDEERSYSFADANAGYETYYRIKTVDAEGQVHFSPVEFVTRPRQPFGIVNVYPIPTAGIVKVEISSDREALAALRIFNLTGQTLFEEEPIELLEGVNLRVITLPAHWADGEYFLEILAGHHRVRATLMLRR